ncbi:hypothetical protein BX667DRAFT_508696 [Coemansia mojavensis]|nr:hypothetical protein BX667DRAFT_508696 [Coemansia mojavensis]
MGGTQLTVCIDLDDQSSEYSLDASQLRTKIKDFALDNVNTNIGRNWIYVQILDLHNCSYIDVEDSEFVNVYCNKYIYEDKIQLRLGIICSCGARYIHKDIDDYCFSQCSGCEKYRIAYSETFGDNKWFFFPGDMNQKRLHEFLVEQDVAELIEDIHDKNMSEALRKVAELEKEYVEKSKEIQLYVDINNMNDNQLIEFFNEMDPTDNNLDDYYNILNA